jgi:ferric-dicitrate binding protein FerR (iron transport regulator)
MARTGESVDRGPYRKTVTTRLTPQNYERYEAYQEQESLSKSEALRQLIRTGLDASSEESEESEEDREAHEALLSIATVAGIAWIALWFTTGPTGSAVIGGATIVTVILYGLWPALETRL